LKKIILIIFTLFFCITTYAKDYYFITVKSVITHFTYKYIEKALSEATDGDGVLVIKLDTPGGLLNSTRDIVQLIIESSIPVAVFVSPQGARAGSAGTFIVLSANIAAMAEGTNIGAAHPVDITGKDIEGNMNKKIVEDTSAFIESIAEKRGRNVEVAKEMVIESKSLSSKKALESNIIDLVVNNDEELIKEINKKYNFRGDYKAHYIKPTTIEKVAFFLSDPNILMLLLLAGILSIFLEFKMPGTFVFACFGISCLVLFLIGIHIIPVNYLGLLLILAGIILIIAEVFVPSFGLLTFTSIIALSTGMYLLFNKEGTMGVKVSKILIAFLIFVVASIVLLLGRLIYKDKKKLPTVGLEKFIGKNATILSWQGLNGKVLVDGEIWDATSDRAFVKDVVVSIDGYECMRLKVKNIEVNETK
jgi:membrane-bound serine protease (ClpP class)